VIPAPRPTVAQTEILSLINGGCSATTAAKKLGVSAEVIAGHLEAVRHRLGVESTAQAVNNVRALGLF
jgi:DNA-binding CsgD family transcriptional regulator